MCHKTIILHISHFMSHAPSLLFPSHLSTNSFSTCTPVRPSTGPSTRPSLMSTSHGHFSCADPSNVSFDPLAEKHSPTKWTGACDGRSARLISCIHHTNDYRQYCHVGNTAQHCRLGLFQDSDFAGDLKDSTSTSGGILCILGSRTFVANGWICKKQTSADEAPVLDLKTNVLIWGLYFSTTMKAAIEEIPPLFVSSQQFLLCVAGAMEQSCHVFFCAATAMCKRSFGWTSCRGHHAPPFFKFVSVFVFSPFFSHSPRVVKIL